jgi:hypothetical protein
MAVRRRRHVDRVSTYILVWPGDEREQLQFDGEVFWLPSINEVATPGGDSPFRYESAKDAKDEHIPGTVRIYDRVQNVDGNRVKIFSADEFVNWVEGVRHDLLDRGMMICDLATEVPEAIAEGRPLWEASRDAWARLTLEAELNRRRKWEEKGLPPPPSSSEKKVLQALAHMRDRGTEITQIPTADIVGALSGTLPPKGNGQPKPSTPTPEEFIEEKADGKQLFVQAQNFGVKVNKAELEGLMLDDEETCALIAERIRDKAEAAAAP